MQPLFDASEFIDPQAITKALSDVRAYQFESPQMQTARKQQQSAQPMFQQQQDNSTQEGTSAIGTVATLLSFL
jgi:hypothetical protein